MSEHIAIESSEIRAQLGDLSNAASALNGQGRNVEVTGRVPSMAAFLETYDKMLQLILDYKNLLSKYSKACASLDDGFEDAFQYTVQGNSHNRLKSTNLIERLNQEVRRREKIIRIFPNQTSANRLIGAVLMDLHDEWIYSSRKYINFDK